MVTVFASAANVVARDVLYLQSAPMPEREWTNVLRVHYEASRAFAVASLEDEGPHFFVELVDGRVLYLRGGFLAQFQPGPGGGASTALALFPSSEFDVVLDPSSGEAIDLRCGGAPFELDCFLEASRELAWGHAWLSGEVIAGVSYETLRARYES